MVLGKESLDDLEALVTASFAAVLNHGIAPPVYEAKPYGDDRLGVQLNVVPVKDSRTVELTWQLPAMQHLCVLGLFAALDSFALFPHGAALALLATRCARRV